MRDNCLFPSLKKSQIQNVSPAIMDKVQGIRLWFMKMLFQIILMFECRVTLWAGILLFTIMEQYMLCACSETKGIWLFPSWSMTYLVLWNIELLDIHVKIWKDNLTSCRIPASSFYHYFCIKVAWQLFIYLSKKESQI